MAHGPHASFTWLVLVFELDMLALKDRSFSSVLEIHLKKSLIFFSFVLSFWQGFNSLDLYVFSFQ